MQTADTKSKALSAVKERTPEATDIHAIGVVSDFIDGDLVIVAYKQGGEERESYVYMVHGHPTVFGSAEEMARASTGKRRNDPSLFGINTILDVGGISGLIALLIAATLCFVVIKHPDAKIPDILSNALSVILGFYFGSKVGGKKDA